MEIRLVGWLVIVIEFFKQWQSGKNNGLCDCVIIAFNISEKDTPLSILADL